MFERFGEWISSSYPTFWGRGAGRIVKGKNLRFPGVLILLVESGRILPASLKALFVRWPAHVPLWGEYRFASIIFRIDQYFFTPSRST